MKMTNLNNKGFTLIELLVVVGIVGVLSSIAIPAYSDYKKRAYDSASQVQLRNMITAIESGDLFEIGDTASANISFFADGRVINSGGLNLGEVLPGFVADPNVTSLFSFSSTGSDLSYSIISAHCRGEKTYGYVNKEMTSAISASLSSAKPGVIKTLDDLDLSTDCS